MASFLLIKMITLDVFLFSSQLIEINVAIVLFFSKFSHSFVFFTVALWLFSVLKVSSVEQLFIALFFILHVPLLN